MTPFRSPNHATSMELYHSATSTYEVARRRPLGKVHIRAGRLQFLSLSHSPSQVEKQGMISDSQGVKVGFELASSS